MSDLDIMLRGHLHCHPGRRLCQYSITPARSRQYHHGRESVSEGTHGRVSLRGIGGFVNRMFNVLIEHLGGRAAVVRRCQEEVPQEGRRVLRASPVGERHCRRLQATLVETTGLDS